MSYSLGGKSAATSDTTILIYYALSLFSLVIGVSFFIALVGSGISRYVANKENAPFVEQHCSWIFRSLWVTLLLICIITIGGIFLLGAAGVVLPDTTNVSDFSELWADPAIRLALQYIFGMIAGASLVLLWFIYRIIRGGYALVQRRPIKEITMQTL